jgi:hypothetical protein
MGQLKRTLNEYNAGQVSKTLQNHENKFQMIEAFYIEWYNFLFRVMGFTTRKNKK